MPAPRRSPPSTRVQRTARWHGSPIGRPATDAELELGRQRTRTLTRLLLVAGGAALLGVLVAPGALLVPLRALGGTHPPVWLATTLRVLIGLHPVLRTAVIVAGALLIAHLVVAGGLLALQRRTRARQQYITYDVLPALRDDRSPVRGVDLFAGLARLNRPHGRARGAEEVLVFALVGDAGRARMRVRVPLRAARDWGAQLRQQLSGMVPGTSVRPLTDSAGQPGDDLAQAVATPGAAVGWVDLVMAHGVEYPLLDLTRFDADPLGALAAALTPAPELHYCGYELLVRAVEPRWQDGVRAQVARIQAQLAPADLAAHDALLQNAERVGYDVVVRGVVVARTPAAARARLATMRESLAPFDRTTRGRTQRLVVPPLDRLAGAAHGRVVSDRPVVNPRLRLALGALTGVLLATGLLGLCARLQIWPWLPLAVAGQVLDAAPLAVGALLLTLGALAGLAWQHQWMTFPATARARLAAHAHRSAWPGPDWGGLPLPGRVRSVMGVFDLATLWHPPSAEVAPLIACRTIPHLPPPAWAFLAAADADAALAGRALPAPTNPLQLGARRLALAQGHRADGTLALIGPSVRDLRSGWELLGPMGAGKSSLIELLVCELARVGAGCGVIDAKGDLADRLLAALPADARTRVVFVDTGAASLPCINPLDRRLRAAGMSDTQIVGQVEQLFARMDPETWPTAMGMQQFARMGLRALLEGEPTPTLLHLDRFYASGSYRNAVLARVSNPLVRDFWYVEYPAMDPKLRISCDSFRRRLQHLITEPVFQQLFCQVDSTLLLSEIMDNRQILVVKLVPEVLSEAVAGVIATGLLAALALAAFARQRQQPDPDLRWDWPLVVDEIQKFIDAEHPGDAETFFTQTRALGVGIVGAHQGLYQYSDAVRAAALQSLGSLAILGPVKQDARYLVEAYAETGIDEAALAAVRAREEMLIRFPVLGRDTALCEAVPRQRPAAAQPSAALSAALLHAAASAPYRTAIPATPPVMRDDDRHLLALWASAAAHGPALAADAWLDAREPQLNSAQLAALVERLIVRSRQARLAQACALAADPAQLPDAMLATREQSTLRYGVDPALAAVSARLLARRYPADAPRSWGRERQPPQTAHAASEPAPPARIAWLDDGIRAA